MVPERVGASIGSSGARVEFAPGEGRETAPLRHPSGIWPARERWGRSPTASILTLVGLGADVSAPLLGFGAGPWEQERPEEARVSESLGRGLPDCTRSRGLPADLEALH